MISPTDQSNTSFYTISGRRSCENMAQGSQQAVSSAVSGCFDNVWLSYRNWARNNETIIALVDEAINRLVFWAPLGKQDESSRLREAILGCLQLHRVVFGIATDPMPQEHTYGMSVALDSGVTGSWMRFAITVLQVVSPIFQEFTRDASSLELTEKRQARVRLAIERARFILRSCLLLNFWRRSATPRAIMVQGGSFCRINAPNSDQESARLRRHLYVGRRTGKRLGVPVDPVLLESWRGLYSTLFGELLYIIRPLITAETDCAISGFSPWKTFALCFSIDLFSLRTLEHMSSIGNAVAQRELTRRKMRLFLYLLRNPVWGTAFRPQLEKVLSTIQRVPLFGNLVSGYIWEYILYLKLYCAEEG